MQITFFVHQRYQAFERTIRTVKKTLSRQRKKKKEEAYNLQQQTRVNCKAATMLYYSLVRPLVPMKSSRALKTTGCKRAQEKKRVHIYIYIHIPIFGLA